MNLPWKPRALDVVFTSGRDPISCIFNRGSGAGFKNMFKMQYPTHVLWATPEHGQWLATEMLLCGIKEGSLEKYLTGKRFRPFIHSVYRWAGFDDPEVREDVLRFLAQLRQKRKKYDLFGAIRCNKFVRKWMPFIKESQSGDYCSENIFTILKWKGLKGYPSRWNLHDPHPYPLQRFMALHREFMLHYEAKL